MSNPFNPYEGLFDTPNGVGDDRPTAIQVVKDQRVEGIYAGKVALVTGGTNGIGVETARALHATGADVYITARDAAKGETIRNDIMSKSDGKGALEVIFMDMDSLDSVREAARTFLEKCGKLNILVNNAGTCFPRTHCRNQSIACTDYCLVPRYNGYPIQPDKGRV